MSASMVSTALTALLLVFGILRLSSQRTPEAAICSLSKERAQNSSRRPLHPSKTNFEFQFNSSLFFTNLRPSTRLPFWTSDMHSQPLACSACWPRPRTQPAATGGRFFAFPCAHRPLRPICKLVLPPAASTAGRPRTRVRATANRLQMPTRMRGLRSRQRDRSHAPESQGRSGMHALPAWREENGRIKNRGEGFETSSVVSERFGVPPPFS